MVTLAVFKSSSGTIKKMLHGPANYTRDRSLEMKEMADIKLLEVERKESRSHKGSLDQKSFGGTSMNGQQQQVMNESHENKYPLRNLGLLPFRRNPTARAKERNPALIPDPDPMRSPVKINDTTVDNC